MKRCKHCDETRQERFYDSRNNICKSCLVFENNKIFHTVTHPKPKNYADYLKDAGMTEYCKRYLKNFS